jgi:hypothetical protein
MRIYTNGQISTWVKSPVIPCDTLKTISTNPDYIYYEFKTINKVIDLTRAPYMKIRGPRFRVAKIQKEQVIGELYMPYYLEKKMNHPFDWVNNIYGQKVDNLFIRLDLDDFKGDEDKFLNLPDNEIIKILHDYKQSKTIFKEGFCPDYLPNIEHCIEDSIYRGPIKSKGEHIEGNFYYYSTHVMRTVYAPQKGTIGFWQLIKEVAPGDYLLIDQNRDINHYPQDYKDKRFKALLCDKDGNILSNEPFYPGDDLPQLRLAATFEKKQTQSVCLVM